MCDNPGGIANGLGVAAETLEKSGQGPVVAGTGSVHFSWFSCHE
jgi:hypothetical protein